MQKNQTRRSISVSGIHYEQLVLLAQKLGLTVSGALGKIMEDRFLAERIPPMTTAEAEALRRKNSNRSMSKRAANQQPYQRKGSSERKVASREDLPDIHGGGIMVF